MKAYKPIDSRLYTTTSEGAVADRVVPLAPLRSTEAAAAAKKSGAAAAGANTSLATVALTGTAVYVYRHATAASGAPSGS